MTLSKGQIEFMTWFALFYSDSHRLSKRENPVKILTQK
jgi:hypothetical protein